MEIDAKDRRILNALQLDARQSLSALGKKIGLSQPAISERVKKLEEAGVIAGYSAHVNLKAIGIGLEAIVRVRTTHQHINTYVSIFQKMPEVLNVVRVTGEDCFIVQCAFKQAEDLERIVDSLAAYGSVQTSLVLSRPISKFAHLGP